MPNETSGGVSNRLKSTSSTLSHSMASPLTSQPERVVRSSFHPLLFPLPSKKKQLNLSKQARPSSPETSSRLHTPPQPAGMSTRLRSRAPVNLSCKCLLDPRCLIQIYRDIGMSIDPAIDFRIEALRTRSST